MQVRLLVLDIDDCAYSSISERNDKLSQPILDWALKGNYNGLYGCTHRSYLNLDYCKVEALKVAAKQGPIHDFHAITDNFDTHKVIPRFAAIANLPVHAISMHDDILYDTDQCGVTYETIVKPGEMLGKPATGEQKYLSYEQMFANWHTKNPQLTQIARHARRLYPDAQIILDYFDDKRLLCEEALDAPKKNDWPEGVSINAFNYDYENKVIIPVKPTTPALQANSIFAGQLENKPPAVTATTSEERVLGAQMWS